MPSASLKRAALALGVIVLLAAPRLWGQAPGAVFVTVDSVPRTVAVDAATNTAVVANFAGNSLSIIDLAKRQVVATVANVPSPAGVATNSRGTAVVANQFNNSVTVVDIARRLILATISVDSAPVGVAVNPTTNVAVVANSVGNSVSLVDLTALRQTAVVTGIPTASGLQSVAVNPLTNVAVVASTSTNSVFIVDLKTAAIRAQVPVEQLPVGVAVDSSTNTAGVINQSSNSVSLVDLATATVRTTVSSVPSPQGIAFLPNTVSAIVSTGPTNSVVIANLLTGVIDNTIQSVGNGAGVAFSQTTGLTVVALPNENSVVLIPQLGVVAAVNAASFVPGPVAPLSIATAFGTNLTSTTISASAAPLPFVLGGVTVRVGTSLAPLFFVSPGQANFQVPTLSAGTYPVQVSLNNAVVASGTLVVAATAPAIFTLAQTGSGQAAALNQDNRVNGSGVSGVLPTFPAHAGEIIQLFATGGGYTNPIPTPGTAPATAANTVFPATATIGGLAAQVVYSGAAPGLVGAWQVNVKIPASVTISSAVPVLVTINAVTSKQVTIAVE